MAGLAVIIMIIGPWTGQWESDFLVGTAAVLWLFGWIFVGVSLFALLDDASPPVVEFAWKSFLVMSVYTAYFYWAGWLTDRLHDRKKGTQRR